MRAQDTSELQKLKERVDKLEAQQAQATSVPSAEVEELTKIRLELELPEPLARSFTSLGPALSKVYFSRIPLTVGLIGEINYVAQDAGSRITNTERVTPLIGYRFAKNLIFNSGFTFKNGGVSSSGGSGSAQVEFAYVDFLFAEESGLRIGHVLVPFGLNNLRPEPTLDPNVTRAGSETRIIPTPWHENGVLGFARYGSLVVQGGILNSMNAAGYRNGSWIKGGRQDGSNAAASDAAIVLRAEAASLEDISSAGASIYIGNSSQGVSRLGDAKIVMAALHAEHQIDRFAGQFLYVDGWLSDTDRIFAVNGKSIGSRARGGYLTLSYDLLPKLAPIAKNITHKRNSADWRQLPVFVSYQVDDTYAEPASGQPASRDHRIDTIVAGLNYKPHPQVVVKLDHAWQTTGTGTSSRMIEIALGVGF